MKSLIRKLCALLLVATMLFGGAVFNTFAEDDENEYLEFYEQIIFDDLDVAVANGDELIVVVDESTPLLRRSRARNEKAKLEKYLSEHEDAEDYLLDTASGIEELVLLSYTDAPVEIIDGHVERVKKTAKVSSSPLAIHADAAETKIVKGNFTLTTKLVFTGYDTYRAYSKGTWPSSILGVLAGPNYPSAGWDYLTIAANYPFAQPINWIWKWSANPGTGTFIKRFRAEPKWECWQVLEDPKGLAQLVSLELETLSVVMKPNARPSTITIKNHYVHTWASGLTLSLKSSDNGSAINTTTPSLTFSFSGAGSSSHWVLSNTLSYKT